MNDLSISFHMGGFDPDLIRRASGQGFNDVTFQTEGGTNHDLLCDLHQRAGAAGIPELLTSLGMSATAWVHEFDDRREELGPIGLDNDRLWEDLAARYQRIFTETCPWLDRLVLTVSETSVNCTEEALLRKTVGVIHAVCREHGKCLMLRTFVHDPGELGQVAASLEGLPSEVAVMTKMVPQDWTLTDQSDPLIGRVGDRPQVVELDICGEYWRGDLIPHFKGPWLAEHFARWDEYHRLRRGAEPFLEEKEAALNEVLAGLDKARAALDEIAWADPSARIFLSFMFDEMRAYTEASALCQCFWLAASRWLYAEIPSARETAREQALACDKRLAALSPRAGAVLDLDYAGRHWTQYGFQHLDVHGFRAWCRSYWYALFCKK